MKYVTWGNRFILVVIGLMIGVLIVWRNIAVIDGVKRRSRNMVCNVRRITYHRGSILYKMISNGRRSHS